ncbi:MAG: YqeG family HAD IIIA-type phosphatase [Pirellulales bacterium]|nr:YqeG family HAD IIIA-type phosphatase [Pirellulales bacterium]
MSIFSPNLAVKSVLELSRERLTELGLDALLLDVDCTLKEYRSEDVLPEVRDWIDELRAAGVGLCLVSNGLGKRIGRLAEKLDLPYIAAACKPLPFGLRSAVRKMDFDRTRTAMVGDQLFADILAAHLAGIFSILVEPISPEQEPWFTRAKRPLERGLAGGRGET